ncbi:MAG: metal ABC transporter permease, partial [Acidimicrobiia bacterium]|nr:metal ABC transporter permease [Acidimicrobiia bacterium]
VFALLIGPPATAALLLRRVPLIMAAAVLLGSITTTVGILVSYHHDTAAGGTMALSSVALFLAVLVLKVLGRAAVERLRPAQTRTGSAPTSAATP